MKRVVLRLIGVMLALTMCISILPTSVFAWKNLTHVNSADLILLELQRSAKQNGGRASVMVYAPYEDGEGYSYVIPQEYQDALFAYPDAFRAGSMGPDFYPDILTGQGYIHPYDAKKNIGSGEWITLLCDSVNRMPQNSEGRKEALAFTLGFMLHYCGDMFGHDFINTFAGGTYPLLSEVNYLDGTDPNLNIILSHMSEETYMDSQVNWDFYHNNGYLNIAAPIQFVADTLVFNGNVNNGAAKIFEKYGSVPTQYEYLINLRTELYEQAEEWRPSTDPTYTTAVKFLDAWVADLDGAAYALVQCFNNIANRMVTGKNPSTTKIVEEELSYWVKHYGQYITPVPDVVIDGIHIMPNILDLITDAIGLDEFIDDIEKWMMDQIKELALTALGFTGLDEAIDKYKDRMSKPQVQLDHEENPYMTDTDNFSEFEEYIDRYAAEQNQLSGQSLASVLNGTDSGALDNALDSDLEAFYNTLVMFKLVLMGPDNFTDFIRTLSGITQNQYQKSTANLVATSLEMTVKTNTTSGAGTDDNIYAVVLQRKSDGGYRTVKRKLLDKSDYNDFESGDNDTYLVELGEALRLDEMEIWIEQESTNTAASGWDCANITVTPMHAGVKILNSIGLGGNSNMDSGKTWNLHFHDELMSRTAPPSQWTATSIKMRIKTKSNSSILDDYGTNSDIYFEAYDGNTKITSVLLDNPGTDFHNGDDQTYNISLLKNGKGIPLDNISIALKHTGSDEWYCESVEATLYHGEIQLTNKIGLGSKKYEDSTWWLGLENKISGNLRSYSPISLSYETNVDDGAIAYMNSLDDSRQWVNDSSILWNNESVRRDVFFKLFKGFSPDIEYSGNKICQGRTIDINVSFQGVWNGIPQERRDQAVKNDKMPAVNGSATISFINASGATVCSIGQSVSNGMISIRDYTNENLVRGVYDVKVTYTADSADPQYADAEEIFSDTLVVVIRGDLNDDGNVNQKDLAMLSKYMRNATAYPLSKTALVAADINGDGNVNQKDLAILSKYMRNPTAYPLP